MRLARNPGRIAGLWYLLLVALGPLRLMYVPSKLFVSGDAAGTAASIAAHQTLFRAGVASEIMCSVVLVMLTLAFFRLFEGVDRSLAVQVVVIGGVMPATLGFLNGAFDLAALMAVRGPEFLSVFSQPQQDALAMVCLRLGDYTNTAAELLWGVWLIPLGLLVYKSRFLPRFIGVWLLLNGAAYVGVCFTGIFAPAFQGRVFNLAFPVMLGEIVLMLWLVIRGAKPALQAATAAG